uniref:Ig-like domain-containing protein n=1 Tax=Cyprinodon variegatus TaxID=28743 RepID=A0A3Q2D5L5_CYPVA
AVSITDSAHCASTSEAIFGGGTKLTVLDKNIPITPPKVKIFYPSEKECRDYDRKKKRTLLCVASDFYPDHVSVYWKRNGRNITNGVATDPAAKKEEKKYKITSRLKIPLEEWVDPNNKYTCIVTFFDGKNYTDYNDNIEVDDNEIAITRGYYMRVTQNAKVSYTVLIVKSCVYGAFVCFLVWKLQGKRGKQRK